MRKKLISIFLLILMLTVFYNQIAIAKKTGYITTISDTELTKFKDLTVQDKIVDMLDKINYSLVYHYHQKLMSFGPRYTGSKNCSDAGDYIYNAFDDIGLEVSFHHWQFNGFKSRNIEATLEGTQENSSIFIISAHYDCTPSSLGADDDASGVAAILALADVMSGYYFNNTIRFLAVSGEEVGTYGSFCYAKDAYKNKDNIRAVLNLDMIGLSLIHI